MSDTWKHAGDEAAKILDLAAARRDQGEKRKATLAELASEADEVVGPMVQESPMYALEWLLDWQRKIITARPDLVEARKGSGSA